jgi:hypothetical protein
MEEMRFSDIDIEQDFRHPYRVATRDYTKAQVEKSLLQLKYNEIYKKVFLETPGTQKVKDLIAKTDPEAVKVLELMIECDRIMDESRGIKDELDLTERVLRIKSYAYKIEYDSYEKTT